MSDSEEPSLFSLSDSSSQSSSDDDSNDSIGSVLLLVESSDDDSSSSESSSDDDSNDSISSVLLLGETPEQCHKRCCREGDGWSHAFYSRRINRDVGPTHLSICGVRTDIMPFFTIKNWEKMSRGISQYVALTHLELFDMKLSEEAIGALFGGECACNFPQLETLDLSRNELTPDSIMTLIPFLKSRPAIKLLYLEGTGINDEGARLLSDALDQIRIGGLYLNGNCLGNDGIEFLLSAPNSRYLTHLDLGTGDETEIAGLDAISQFLKRDDTELEALTVSIADGESAKMLIESVSSKSKLCDLDLGDGLYHNDEQMKEVITAIQSLVCNTTSFDSLCESNHRTTGTGGLHIPMLRRNGATTALIKAIEINTRESQSIAQRRRSKLRTIYFQGDFDVQPFVKMDVKLIPHVLELVTKTSLVVRQTRVDETSDGEEVKAVDDIENYYEVGSKNVGGIYRLVRNCHIPGLFTFPSPESKLREQEATLEVSNAKVKDLEAQIALLEERNAQLMRENEELQVGSDSGQPKKRAKTGLS